MNGYDHIESYVKSILEKEYYAGWEHTLRVAEICNKISQGLPVNNKILWAAAYLHDIGVPEFRKTQEDHAVIAINMAKPKLLEWCYSEDEIEHICEAIRTHWFDTGQPKSLEAKILRDADVIDLLGAVGIAREFIFMGNLGMPMVEGIKELLAFCDAGFYTQTGTQFALDRLNYTKQFLKYYEDELHQYSRGAGSTELLEHNNNAQNK